jgi:hypothetical protein
MARRTRARRMGWWGRACVRGVCLTHVDRHALQELTRMDKMLYGSHARKSQPQPQPASASKSWRG